MSSPGLMAGVLSATLLPAGRRIGHSGMHSANTLAKCLVRLPGAVTAGVAVSYFRSSCPLQLAFCVYLSCFGSSAVVPTFAGSFFQPYCLSNSSGVSVAWPSSVCTT